MRDGIAVLLGVGVLLLVTIVAFGLYEQTEQSAGRRMDDDRTDRGDGWDDWN